MPDKDELIGRLADLIDTFELHKTALEGKSDLKIGNATVIHDFDCAIRAMWDARELLK